MARTQQQQQQRLAGNPANICEYTLRKQCASRHRVFRARLSIVCYFREKCYEIFYFWVNRKLIARMRSTHFTVFCVSLMSAVLFCCISRNSFLSVRLLLLRQLRARVHVHGYVCVCVCVHIVIGIFMLFSKGTGQCLYLCLLHLCSRSTRWCCLSHSLT